MIDDHMQRAHVLFPDRKDFLWMATRGTEGTAPRERSVYFPNAGHFVFRTGWGPKERYLFMDAGPVGASHGKEDKLGIYVDYGHQLLASGGRGSYSGGPFTAYTGSTRAYNTLLVDGRVQARIPHRAEIDGREPENRRFLESERFDYGEGFHTHGWYSTEGHTAGRQTRQVVFVKGPNPPGTAYWIVIDTVEPADEEIHEYEAMFHIRRNHARVANEKRMIVHGWDQGASLRIVPVDTRELDVELVRGQTQPHVQGWHVVGKARAPMWTPIFRWKATGRTTRAWVLIPADADQRWCIDDVELLEAKPGMMQVRCHRPDGSFDVVTRRRRNPASPDPDVTIEAFDSRGDGVAKLEVGN